MERRIQYLGESGHTYNCLIAIHAILESGVPPEEATVVSCEYGGPRQTDHLFLFWNWGHFPVTIVPSGFASGYRGEGPKGFSLALCMIREKGIAIKQIDVDASLFRMLDEGRISHPKSKHLNRMKAQSEVLPFPFPEWVHEEHEALLKKGQLWKAYYWRETKTDWLNEAVEVIDNYDPGVGEKLRLALAQLEKAETTEEYQQIGIVVRDAWIEIMQKLWASTSGIDKAGVGPDDVKGMLGRFKLGDKPANIAKSAYELSVGIQHDRRVAASVTRACVATTALAMNMLLDLIHQKFGAHQQAYYRCPKCTSLDLFTVTKGVMDYDGSPIPMDYLVCRKCGWSIEETGLTTPPFDSETK